MMSRINVKWYGRRFDRDVKRHMTKNLAVAARFYREQIVAMISTQGPPRSAPHRPPHREFGNLIASYLVELDARIMTARIGSGMIPTKGRLAPYARYLEYGFVTNFGIPVKPRPHIRPALYNNMDAIGRRLTEPMK